MESGETNRRAANTAERKVTRQELLAYVYDDLSAERAHDIERVAEIDVELAARISLYRFLASATARGKTHRRKALR